MPLQEEMTIDERRKYVKLMTSRYQHASRTQRSALLTEMEQVTHLHRKHLTRLLGGASLERKKRQTPRRRTYGVKELHPDNGPEFFNAHLVHYWKEKVTGVQLSRSRPYHKSVPFLVEGTNLVR